MPFDGITIHALTEEISEYLVGSKIDKVHQPESDEIVLLIRKDRKNLRLLLSADSNLPHFSVSSSKKENPTQAPMFCMLLRKHLSGGKILSIEQLGLERVLIITIESKSELGDFSIKRIIFEIMGKHSNITLVDENDKIIDCIKRIALGVNRYRQLFPGITYMYPPNEKVDPRNTKRDDFVKTIKSTDSIKLFKYIYMTYQGISPIISKEICLNAEVDFNIEIVNLTDDDLVRLYDSFIKFFNSIDNKKYFKNVVYNKDLSLKDLSVVSLSPYESDEFIVTEFDLVNEVVNEYYANKNTVNKLLQRSHNLRRSVQSKIDKSYKKISNLKKDLQFADNAEDYKIKGDLILANLYRIERGMNKVKVENFDTDVIPCLQYRVYKKYLRPDKDNENYIEGIKFENT